MSTRNSCPSRGSLFTIAIVALASLVAAALACNTTNMRARDLPVWACPTPTINPICLITPEAAGTGTPGTPGADTTPIATISYPPECFLPTATPYERFTDFRLGRRVRIGGVMGIGMGIWVTMDHVQIDGPYSVTDPQSGATSERWVASWDTWIHNASLTNTYEMYPFSQLYVLTVRQDGADVVGAWPISGEAHRQIGLPELTLDEGTAVLNPGERVQYRVAAFIPAPDVWRLGYILDPFDTQDVEEMVEKHSLGSNVGVWVNEHENLCKYDDINPLLYQFSGDPNAAPGAYVPGYLLTRHPVSAVHISRGFGCNEYWTGTLGSDCPADRPWFHDGVDYAIGKGTPFYDGLPVAGSVIFAGQDDGPDCSPTSGSEAPHNGYGNFVKYFGVVEGHTVVIWGAHLSGFNTTSGAATSPGQVLGAIGSTGCSTGPHLHFKVKVDGYVVDPLLLIPPGAPPGE